jgi:peptidoglycan/LPS O-acetylase OafA/YrhL
MTENPLAPAPHRKNNGQRETSRIPELDGLRGIAILLVVACHYVGSAAFQTPSSFYSWLSRFAILGEYGVDLFFVLSGFLIGGILLRARTSPSYYRPFYIRRFYRIIPIYYVWLAFCGLLILAGRMWGGSASQFFHLATPPWAYPLFLQNFFYIEPTFQMYCLGPLWSLAVEEQFYLLVPFLVRSLKPRRLIQVLSAILIIAPLLRWTFVTRLSWGNGPAQQWMICRSDSLGAGVLLAHAWNSLTVREWLISKLRKLSGLFIFILALSIAALVACLVYGSPAAWPARLARESLPYFFSFTILLALSNSNGIVAAALRNSGLRWFGKVSYCTYIIHWAVNWALHGLILHSPPRVNSLESVGVTVIALFVTMGIAEMSWRFLEHPLIFRGHRYSY